MKAHSISWVSEIQINITHSMKLYNLEAEISKSWKGFQSYVFRPQNPRPYIKILTPVFRSHTQDKVRQHPWGFLYRWSSLPKKSRSPHRVHESLGTGWQLLLMLMRWIMTQSAISMLVNYSKECNVSKDWGQRCFSMYTEEAYVYGANAEPLSPSDWYQTITWAEVHIYCQATET